MWIRQASAQNDSAACIAAAATYCSDSGPRTSDPVIEKQTWYCYQLHEECLSFIDPTICAIIGYILDLYKKIVFALLVKYDMKSKQKVQKAWTHLLKLYSIDIFWW